MHARLGHHASARPLLEAACGQFQRIGMTGWLRQAEQVAAIVSSRPLSLSLSQPGPERPRPGRDRTATAGTHAGLWRRESIMKAIRVHSYGQPPSLDDMPEPRATGPDDVVVRIGGAGLCRTDLHIIDGWFADVIPSDLPVVLGHENAGWVHAVGPAVEHLAVGDPVICHPNLTCGVCRACRAGDDMRCGQGPNLPGLMSAGGMAELFKTTARAIVKLPAGVEPADVAALADALTAYHAVRKAVPAGPRLPPPSPWARAA